MDSKGAVIDKLELYRIENDTWKLDLVTEYNIPWYKRILKYFGLYRCIDDALTNYAVQDIVDYLYTKYSYASVGIDGTEGTNYDLTDLKSPVMGRFLCTKSIGTTYATDDTLILTSIVTATGDYTLTEFGIHDVETAGNMGARQTSCTWDVVNNETFGMIWRFVVSRG